MSPSPEPTGPAGESARETQDGEAKKIPAPDAANTRRELTPDQQEDVRELQKIDRATRTHEQAHMAAGGGLVTHGATYSFRTGPDGQRYAVAGEVGIDVSPEKDPVATISKMRRVRAAALAPADPSATDRAVAARAQAAAAAAQMEIARRAGEGEEGSAIESDRPARADGSAAADAQGTVGESKTDFGTNPLADGNASTSDLRARRLVDITV